MQVDVGGTLHVCQFSMRLEQACHTGPVLLIGKPVQEHSTRCYNTNRGPCCQKVPNFVDSGKIY